MGLVTFLCCQNPRVQSADPVLVLSLQEPETLNTRSDFMLINLVSDQVVFSRISVLVANVR